MRHSPTHEGIHVKTTARHRREPQSASMKLRLLWPTDRSRRVALAASALTCLAFAAMATSSVAGTPEQDLTLSAAAERATAERVSRSSDRQASAQAAPAKTAAPAKAKAAAPAKPAAKPAAKPVAKKPAQPKPVAGLSQKQMNNAQRIVAAGQKLGLPKRAYVIAVATALQESQLLNLGSTAIPESRRYAPEGSGSDHDSVGLFQQRPSAGWGSVKNLMTPSYSATAFYKALRSVPGWQKMALTYAAQAVQVSAYPEAYAKHEWRAKKVVDALT